MKSRFLLYVFALLALNGFGQGASWSAVLPAQFPVNSSGQINGISRVSQMKFHPSDSSKMYAMSARGGLFITKDGGNNWTVAPGTDFMPDNRLASVCVDFTNDSVIYIGTGDHDYYYGGSGVWKSKDGGQTFNQTTLNNVMAVEMAMHPTNNNIIVAATDGGIYKTYDAGVSWTAKTSTSLQFDDMKKVEFPTSQTLFATTIDSMLFRSVDFGETWVQITNGIQLPDGITSGDGCRIALTPADTNIVYLGMVANGGTIYKSINGGSSFAAVKNSAAPYLTYYDDTSSSSTQGDYNFSIGADRANPNILYLVAHNVWRSLDGGRTWMQLTHWWEKVHTDMHQIIVNPYHINQLWNMNDGGVWLSVDTGNTWVPKSNGIAGEEIYHGNCSPTRRDMMSIGTQDNGELYADAAGWFTNRGGDWGSECAFDYRAASAMVYYFQDATRRIVSGGTNTYGLPVTEVEDMTFNRSNADLAFVADSTIYRTSNLSADTPVWTQIASLNEPVMAIHNDLTDTNHLYVITDNNKLYVSANAMSGTPAFSVYTLPHATNNAATITSIKDKPGVIYITCNNRVYRSPNYGVSLTNVTYNLPSVNQVRILSDEFYPDSETVFIASNNAVYYKTLSQNSWTLFDLNLPSRPYITDMSVYNDSTANAMLRVAVYGRGMWETPISGMRPLKAIMTVDNSSACRGVPVTFSDISTGLITSRKWNFPDGSPSFSTDSNPAVTYNAYGAYNATLTVYNTADSSTTIRNYYVTVNAGVELNVSQGFESDTFPPPGWSLVDVNSDGYNWQWYSGGGAYGTSSACMYFDNYYQAANGDFNDVLTPKYDFTGYDSIWLTFDHAYRVYTDPTEIDTFEILISTDCGVTFNPVYREGGAQFATVAGLGSYTDPSDSDWRTDTVDLSLFTGQSVILAFRNIGHYGNSMFVDNINISAGVLANAGKDTLLCPGNDANIGMNTVSGVTYQWSPVTGLSSALVSNPVASPLISTRYVLTATQDSSGIFSMDTVNVFVGAASDDSIYSRNDTLFAAITTDTYQWLLNGNPIPSAVNGFYVPEASGDYSLFSTNPNGCSNTSNHFLFTGLQNIEEDGIRVFPNPLSGGNWQLVLGNTFINSRVEVYDNQGNLVYTGQATNNRSEIDTNLPGGVYLLRISNNSQNIVRKLVRL